MKTPPPLSGSLDQWDLASILFHMYTQERNGLVKVQCSTFWKGIFVEDQKVVYVSSSNPEDSLTDFLLMRGSIDSGTKQRILAFSRENNVSCERSIMEMGILGPDTLWTEVYRYYQDLAFPLLIRTDVKFDISAREPPLNAEPVTLDTPVPLFILEGIRLISDEQFITDRFKNREELFLADSAAASSYPLKPYEIHLLKLVRRHSTLGEILKKSPLTPLLNLKILYFFLTVGILSCKSEPPPPQPGERERHWIPSFNSFEEALAYFNHRFEYIYRLLSKEIGPVAASILFDSIQSIVERVPPYLSHIQINKNGTLDEKPILKALWYLNFEQTIAEFLTGLEEILYAEIYAVKKHLGKEYEQLILQWIREKGDS